MLSRIRRTVLLVSPQSPFRDALKTTLERLETVVEVEGNEQSVQARVAALPDSAILLLDVRMAGIANGQLLAQIEESGIHRRCAIALVAEPMVGGMADELWDERWIERLREGVVDDIVPRNADAAAWSCHLRSMLRGHRLYCEVETLREAAMPQAQDRLTGILNREGILSALFRETDRVQRQRGTLSLVMLDIDDFRHWNAELGASACDILLKTVAERIRGLLRSYDLLGRIGGDEFLIALPGCTTLNAQMLAERLRMDVFEEPFEVVAPEGAGQVRLTACYSAGSSRGRSPLVVLRELEQSLAEARLSGPDAIRFAIDEARDGWTSVPGAGHDVREKFVLS